MNLTVDDVTKFFSVSEKTIYRWIKSNGLPAYRVNNQYRFNRTDIIEWASAQRVHIAPDSVINIPPAAVDQVLPDLSEALEQGGIFYRLSGRDKPSVLREIVSFLKLPDRFDRDNLFSVLLAREELGSTAIGDGIAIPHARNPIVLNVPVPSVTLTFLDEPIEFGAIDGMPVNTLFTVISTTTQVHLHLLSRIAFALRQEGFRNAVMSQASRDVILSEAREVAKIIKHPRHE